MFPNCSENASEIIIEYLERRLLSVVKKTWAGKQGVNCYYISSDKDADVEVIGSIHCQLQINSRPISIWFGIGVRVLSILDQFWLDTVTSKLSKDKREFIQDKDNSVIIEVAELSVPPADLIDYTRSGTLIDLEIPLSSNVNLRMNNGLWLEGKLLCNNSCYAIEVIGSKPKAKKHKKGNTKVQIVLSQFDVDKKTAIIHEQIGSIIQTKTQLNSNAVMFVGGEQVASGLLGKS